MSAKGRSIPPSAVGKRKQPIALSKNEKKRQKTAVTQTCLFFTLPRELRDRIYEEIWPEKDGFYIDYKNIMFAVTYQKEAVPRGFASREGSEYVAFWFLACRQMMDEAVSQFSRVAEWYSMWVRTAPVCTPPDPPAKHLLISPWVTKRLSLGVFELVKRRDAHNLEEASGRGNIVFQEPDVAHLRQFDNLKPKIPTLRHLTVHVSMEPYTLAKLTAQDEEDAGIDFSPLKLLMVPSIQRLDINISFARASHVFEEKVKAKMGDTATQLLGPNTKTKPGQGTQRRSWVFEICTVLRGLVRLLACS